MTVLSIRGTHGSAKSTIVRELLKLASKKIPIYGALGPRMPEAYELVLTGVKRPVFILGSYEIPTGGCDLIQPYDIILDLITKYAARGHVILEGALVSSSYGRVGQLMEQWGQDSIMAFLDTPLETCIANVEGRRKVRGDVRPFDPKNLTSKFNQIGKSRIKMEAEGKLRTVTLNYGKGSEQILTLLREAV